MSQHLPAAARYMRDISDYQLGFEAQRVRRAGSLVIMIKRAEGCSTIGAAHGQERARAARHVGMRVIDYQLLLAGPHTGKAQALFLLDQIGADFRPGDRLLADIEDASGFADATHAEQTLAEWKDTLHAHGHTSPIGYTNRAYPYLNAIACLFANTGWVIADYGILRRPNPLDGRAINWRKPAPDGKLRVPLLGRQFTDGQHGAQPHTCPGITGPVDCTWLTDNGIRTILQRDP